MMRIAGQAPPLSGFGIPALPAVPRETEPIATAPSMEPGDSDLHQQQPTMNSMSTTFLSPGGSARVWLASARPLTQRPLFLAISSSRLFSSKNNSELSPSTPDASSSLPPPPPQRWISDLRVRVGKCLMFGCNETQIARAALVMRALATEWRDLLAGSEGYLTGGRGGLDGREIAWGEQDTFGHVNNVNYFRYAESARVNWVTNFAVHDPENREQWLELMTPKSTGLIMRGIKADFKFPLVYPDKISVYHRLSSPPLPEVTNLNQGESQPPSFFTLTSLVLSHNHRRIACRLEEDIVIYDYIRGAKTAMPPFMSRVLEGVWREQERETRRARERVWELVAAVDGLERETWNREGAVEDLGTAKRT
ncbi:hypothetical protein VTJ49DRAFT_6535 [Mycothermus thermophilus]|uniref:Thioesterase/thiol ester dehydrase-isomerase n=1 Tax=Humicola insolens TaxID=85995 RepID=A0ABR3V299_HUMIN